MWLPPSASDPGHVTVLLHEAVDALDVRAGGIYVDATFGGGGHTREILEREPPAGLVLAIDADPEARARAARLAASLPDPARFRFVRGNFGAVAEILAAVGIGAVDGILFDLGLSSFQLDAPERGFAFRFEGPLDMRFGQEESTPTVADILTMAPVEELTAILRTYGEEPRARRIARAIDQARQRAPITSTTQLAEIVVSVTGPQRGRSIHPATRTFQALRIAANRELDVLGEALDQVPNLLRPGGRLVVLSFHSLEDRIVKRFIEHQAATCICPPEQPICTCDHLPTLRKVGKPLRAPAAEQQRNPRSRSVIMRVAERLSVDEARALKRTLRTHD